MKIWEYVLGGNVFKIGLCCHSDTDEELDEDWRGIDDDWPYDPQPHLWIEKMLPIEEENMQNSITFKYRVTDFAESSTDSWEGCKGAMLHRPPDYFFALIYHTSRKISSEAIESLYRHNVFSFGYPEALEFFIRRLSPFNIANLRALRFSSQAINSPNEFWISSWDRCLKPLATGTFSRLQSIELEAVGILDPQLPALQFYPQICQRITRSVKELQELLVLLSWLTRVRQLRLKSIPILLTLWVNILPSETLSQDEQYKTVMENATATLFAARNEILEQIAVAEPVTLAAPPAHSAPEPLPSPASSSLDGGSDDGDDSPSPGPARILEFDSQSGCYDLEIMDSYDESDSSAEDDFLQPVSTTFVPNWHGTDTYYENALKEMRGVVGSWDAMMGLDPDMRNENGGSAARS